MLQAINKLELEILNCRQRDAAELKRALKAAWQFCSAPHDAEADSMERAKLACQTRDAEVLREAASAVSHGHAPRGMGGAARA